MTEKELIEFVVDCPGLTVSELCLLIETFHPGKGKIGSIASRLYKAAQKGLITRKEDLSVMAKRSGRRLRDVLNMPAGQRKGRFTAYRYYPSQNLTPPSSR